MRIFIEHSTFATVLLWVFNIEIVFLFVLICYRSIQLSRVKEIEYKMVFKKYGGKND